MSLLEVQAIACPACGHRKQADIFYSINADRRPDLRAGVIDGSFQREICESCHTEFRIDPEFNYLDMGRGQWISVHPLKLLRDWERVEAEDQAAFDKAYGKDASEGAQEIGRALTVRVTFGWPAFREKLVAADAVLDDRELELLKMAILRTMNDAPLSDEVELRFIDRTDNGELMLTWVNALTDTPVQTLVVPQKAYDEIAVDAEGWKALREELSKGLFVDMQRLIV